MEALGRFAGGIAHDFNNLLTAIMGQLEVTLDDLPPGSPVRQELASVQRSAERMAALTRQILAFGRRQVVHPVVLDLCAVVHEFRPALARLMGDGTQLSIACARDGATVVADRAQVEQVVLNLVVNARDAMPNGGTVVVRVDEDEISPVEAAQYGRRAGPAVRLRVQDTGDGIEPALQARIFEPFFTTKAPGKGTGLGLATVYAIMQQNEGMIRVDSLPGRGTTFDVLWPAAAPSDGMRATSGPRPAVSASAVPPRETILVVDDEAEVRQLETTALRRLGYTVLAAADGVEATELAASHDGAIHLVVTDCVMPRMGGRELAAALRRSRPDTKVLFVSGHTDDEALLAAIAHEQAAFLPKPFGPGTLAARVREVLDA
jgi:CheY-like chemotaxis protein